jgi:hypothetical protein
MEFLASLGYSFITIPKCMFKMRPKKFDPSHADGHDFVAAKTGAAFDEACRRLIV